MFDSEEKRDKGNAYARENFGTPELFNVLQPRTRGFVTCLSQLRDSLDAGAISHTSAYKSIVLATSYWIYNVQCCACAVYDY